MTHWIGRILLDNDSFVVTAGLLGGIKVKLKSRGVTLKANRFERTKLLDVLDELKCRGGSVEPHSKEFEEILDQFSQALWGRGDPRWQAYFLVMTYKDIVDDIVVDGHTELMATTTGKTKTIYLPELGGKRDPIKDLGRPAQEGDPILGASLVGSKSFPKDYGKPSKENSTGSKKPKK